MARLVPFYEFDERQFFDADGAPPAVAARRRTAFYDLSSRLQDRAPVSIAATDAVTPAISDLQFTASYRVPFQFSNMTRRHLKVGSMVRATSTVMVEDLDGNLAYDVAGSYGVNVFGYDFYKDCIAAAAGRVAALGPVLGSYHPVVADNVARLQTISGLAEVSFHMSGTEAVMQAVRLARYHTGRTHVVQFCGAYHGWWDDVQPGVGNPNAVGRTYVLRDLDRRALNVIDRRRDIACVLINPLQMLHPNSSAPGDASLVTGAAGQSGVVDRASYGAWLRELRDACTARGIALIFDEVFLGFRLAYGGAQEYFGVQADMVTYGKTLGGGLPVGVLCGRSRFMKRSKDDQPANICFARGTFNAHPYVMAAMNEFLTRIDTPGVRASYAEADALWNTRAASINRRLDAEQLPVRVANLCSVWTIRYLTSSRYHWMFQYCLRAHGLALSWVGSGRLIFSHNYSDADFAAVADRIVAAAREMRAGGWWWESPAVTPRTIQRQVLREMVRAAVSPRRQERLTRPPAKRSDRSVAPSAARVEPFDRAPHRGTGR